jgi:hypothetical protein
MPGDFYRLLEGMGENWDFVLEELSKIANLRDPKLTTILSDLEKEYGIINDDGLTEQERRDQLSAIVYAPKNTGTDTYLQGILRDAGFNVQVHINSPSVSPAPFIGGGGGELITNNKQYERSPIDAYRNWKHYGYVFFIGGNATRDSDGRITSIDVSVIDEKLKPRFRNLVLRYKPLHSWAVALINEAGFFTFSDNDLYEDNDLEGFADDESTIGGFWTGEE